MWPQGVEPCAQGGGPCPRLRLAVNPCCRRNERASVFLPPPATTKKTSRPTADRCENVPHWNRLFLQARQTAVRQDLARFVRRPTGVRILWLQGIEPCHRFPPPQRQPLYGGTCYAERPYGVDVRGLAVPSSHKKTTPGREARGRLQWCYDGHQSRLRTQNVIVSHNHCTRTVAPRSHPLQENYEKTFAKKAPPAGWATGRGRLTRIS